MRLVSLLLIFLACRADAGSPGCPDCDKARERASKLGPDAAAEALLGDDAMCVGDRLVELGGLAVVSLLKQFAGPKCAVPRGPDTPWNEAEQGWRHYRATHCEEMTAKALATVLCGRDQLEQRWVALVSKRLDARLVSWLPLDDYCSPSVLHVLVPRVLAVVGAQWSRGPFLHTLVRLEERALPALPCPGPWRPSLRARSRRFRRSICSRAWAGPPGVRGPRWRSSRNLQTSRCRRRRSRRPPHRHARAVRAAPRGGDHS